MGRGHAYREAGRGQGPGGGHSLPDRQPGPTLAGLPWVLAASIWAPGAVDDAPKSLT